MKLENKLFTEVFNRSDVFLLTCTSSYTYPFDYVTAKVEVKTFFGESKISYKTLCQFFSKLETFMLLYSRIYMNGLHTRLCHYQEVFTILLEIFH